MLSRYMKSINAVIKTLLDKVNLTEVNMEVREMTDIEKFSMGRPTQERVFVIALKTKSIINPEVVWLKEWVDGREGQLRIPDEYVK